jgi:hypothetical protein
LKLILEVSDASLFEHDLGRADVRRDEIAITLRSGDSAQEAVPPNVAPTISVAFKQALLPRKGLAHAPPGGQGMADATRTALLAAIARSKAWVEAQSRIVTTIFAGNGGTTRDRYISRPGASSIALTVSTSP